MDPPQSKQTLAVARTAAKRCAGRCPPHGVIAPGCPGSAAARHACALPVLAISQGLPPRGPIPRRPSGHHSTRTTADLAVSRCHRSSLLSARTPLRIYPGWPVGTFKSRSLPKALCEDSPSGVRRFACSTLATDLFLFPGHISAPSSFHLASPCFW